MGKTGRGGPREVSPLEKKQRAATAAQHGPWRNHGWRVVLIWALMLIAYSNSFQSGLVFDNASIIGRDPRIRQARLQNIEAILDGGYRHNNPTDGPVPAFDQASAMLSAGEYQAAVRIAPDLMEAHVNLGNALAQTPGRQAEAIAEYEAALRIRPDPVARQMLEKLR